MQRKPSDNSSRQAKCCDLLSGPWEVHATEMRGFGSSLEDSRTRVDSSGIIFCFGLRPASCCHPLFRGSQAQVSKTWLVLPDCHSAASNWSHRQRLRDQYHPSSPSDHVRGRQSILITTPLPVTWLSWAWLSSIFLSLGSRDTGQCQLVAM